jgi:hypothetical protein
MLAAAAMRARFFASVEARPNACAEARARAPISPMTPCTSLEGASPVISSFPF